MTLVTIVLLACVTFTTRYLFLEGRLPVRLSSNFKQFLSFSGPAVLSAIFVPILLVHDHQLDLSLQNPYLWGGAMAVAVGYRTGSVYWTVGLGTLVFVLVGYVF